MKAFALQKATEKGLPQDLVNYAVRLTEEDTLSELNNIEQVWNKAITEKAGKVFKNNGRVPEKGDSSKSTYTREEVEKMSQSEVNANLDKIMTSMKAW